VTTQYRERAAAIVDDHCSGDRCGEYRLQGLDGFCSQSCERLADAIASLLSQVAEESAREADELMEPMGCGHFAANLQPSDEGPDGCIVCWEIADMFSKAPLIPCKGCGVPHNYVEMDEWYCPKCCPAPKEEAK
jgi:hypothetical protein